MPKFTRWWILKPVILLACFTPLVWITFAALTNRLSANPIKDITEFTGIWTLRFLMITLSITPLRRIRGVSSLIRFRRMLGLFTFFHAFLHSMTYICLNQFFMWGEIANDSVKLPCILSGIV